MKTDVIAASHPRARVAVVVSDLSKVLGIESATVSLVNALATDYNVSVIAIAGEASTVSWPSSVSVESWGARVTGWGRLITIVRAFRHRKALPDSTIILSGAWAAIPMLFALPKRSRMQTLVWEHSFDDEKVSSNRSLAILRAIARPLYARARVTIAVSDSLRRDMRAAGFGGTIEVIPNVIRKFDSGPSAEVIAGRLLTIGRLVKTKNQSLAVRTLALLPPYFSLDILGDGPDRNTLEQLAIGLRVADRVHFQGHLANPAEYFTRAQCVMHPSVGETYGLVLYEAAHFGKPVVAVNRSVMAEVIPQLIPGLVAEPQPGAFASAILSLDATPVGERAVADAAHQRKLLSQNIIRDWHRLIDCLPACENGVT